MWERQGYGHCRDFLNLSASDIERAIHVVRGHRVMFDSDLRREHVRLNQAVKRNPEGFPSDFAYQLTGAEFAELKSQTVTSKTGCGGRTKSPWVFIRVK